MSDFLGLMAVSSAARARAAAPASELRRRIADRAPPPRLSLGTFDLIAEVKRRAPSAGQLAGAGLDVVAQAQAYAAGGAAAISVLTEPSRFDGALEHLQAVAGAVPVPVMRKDFLVDPIQVLEAAAYGAGGVLLILRMLDDARLGEMQAAAREHGLFVLLEAFDAEELGRVPVGASELVGLNCRDLATLQVDPARFAERVGAFPPGCTKVAESGLATPEDAGRVRGLGYEVALVGSALMRSGDPTALVAAMLEAPCASA